jgi:ATP/ADP translocase
MNEMYEMSIVTHNYSVYFLLGVILLNLLFLVTAKEIKKFKRTMRLFNPYTGIGIGGVVFTGVVMMAAKHLDFTIENIVMIAFSVALIMLEVKRTTRLKYTNSKEVNALENYKEFAFKIIAIEILLVMSVSTWMWTLA